MMDITEENIRELIAQLRQRADAYREERLRQDADGRVCAVEEAMLNDAANAIEFLDNGGAMVVDELREQLTENRRLRAELANVKRERDAYHRYVLEWSSKPDCNTCKNRGCEYRPGIGETVRKNCPLYRGPEKED